MYYLSAEFLMGRTLTNAVRALGLGGAYGKALEEMGAQMEQVRGQAGRRSRARQAGRLVHLKGQVAGSAAA